MTDARALAAKHITGGRGTCQACGREIACRKSDGIPARPHKATHDHGNGVAVSVDCYGSRLPVAEYAAAFDAARLADRS